METEEKSPATTAENAVPVSKEDDITSWGQSVKDSQWATSEPITLDPPYRSNTNSSGSQWAPNNNNSYNSYGRERKYNDYGSNDRYKRDNYHQGQKSDGWRSGPRHNDYRPFNRFQQDDSDFNRPYGNRGNNSPDNRYNNRPMNSWRSDNNYGSDQGYRSHGRTMGNNYRPSYDNSFTSRNYDSNQNPRYDSPYDRSNDHSNDRPYDRPGWRKNYQGGRSDDPDNRRQFHHNDSYSHGSRYDSDGRGKDYVNKTKEPASTAEDRPWNKRFLSSDKDNDNSETSPNANDYGPAEETTASNYQSKPQESVPESKVVSHVHAVDGTKGDQDRAQAPSSSELNAEFAKEIPSTAEKINASNPVVEHSLPNSENTVDGTESRPQVELDNSVKQQDHTTESKLDDVNYSSTQADLGDPQSAAVENDVSVSGDKDESPTRERRLSIEAGFWGRPPSDGNNVPNHGDETESTSALNKSAALTDKSLDEGVTSHTGAEFKPSAADSHFSHDTHQFQGPSATTHTTGISPSSILDRLGSRATHRSTNKSHNSEHRLAAGGYTKASLDEDALNARIERIRLQNEQIERKKKIVQEEEKELARQLQLEKAEREKRRLADEELAQESRLADEQKVRERQEREKRIADEIRAEREANAARKAQAIASRDWDVTKGDEEVNINDGRSWSDFVDDKFHSDRSRLTRHRPEQQGNRGHLGTGSEPSGYRRFPRNERKQDHIEKPFSLTEEKWPDLVGTSASPSSASKPAVWPGRAALEAKAATETSLPATSPPAAQTSPIGTARLVPLKSMKVQSPATSSESHQTEQKHVEPHPSLKWEDLIAKQKPVTDWAADSPNGETLDFEDSPFG
ncbi:hypothetical protein Unana1_06308 [Umbelopsis nana]